MSTKPPFDPFLAMAQRASRVDEFIARSRKVQLEAIDKDLQNGRVDSLEDYVIGHSDCHHSAKDFLRIVFNICTKPESYKIKEQILDTVPNRFYLSTEFREAVIKTGNMLPALLSHQDHAEDYDALRAAARLQVEKTRMELRLGREITILPSDRIKEQKFLARMLFREEELQRFVRIQNALVDQVENASANDAVTGVGFLKTAAFLPEAELWTRKIKSIKQSGFMPTITGRPTTLIPVY